MRLVAMAAGCVLSFLPMMPAHAQTQGARRATHAVFTMPDGVRMTYGLSVPHGDGPHPLVLALHPGGGRMAYYGTSFMQNIVEPALRDWNALIVAPDVPTRSWASDLADRAVMALLADVSARHDIDSTRVLVTGFSLGGHGTWFFATRHPDLFTGAIPIAGAPGDHTLDSLGTMPVHIIHSQDDEVVAYGPAAEAARQLADRSNPVELTLLHGIGHFTMGAYVEPLRAASEWIVAQWEQN